MSGTAPPPVRLLLVAGALVAAAALLVVAAGSLRPAVRVASAAGDPVVAAAGDVVCDPTLTDPDPGGRDPGQCQQRRTADLLAAQPLAAVLGLGDLQYADGTLAKFRAGYDPTWGRFRAITRPVVGNHEYLTPGAAGYFDYFGAAAGDRGAGWYSADVGAWHLVALNANCDQVGCGPGSPQDRWLRADLAAHPTACTLAYFHQPRWTSSPRGANASLAPLWQAMYDGGVDLVLNGHEHNYERFAAQDPAGRADPRGIRQIIVGTGGRSVSPFGPPTANSEVRSTAGFGVLLVTLHATSYDWRFAAASGAAVDAGSTACTSSAAPPGPAASTPPPSSPPASVPPVSVPPAPPSTGPVPPTTAPPVPPSSAPPVPPTSSPPVPPPPSTPGCAAPSTQVSASVSSAGSAVGVRVRGTAGRAVDLYAVTLPSSSPVRVRRGVLGSDGTSSFSVRPVRSTRVSATAPGCGSGAAVTVAVRTGVSVGARRLGVRTYAFSGRTTPARPAGTLVTVAATSSARTTRVSTRTAADGTWRAVVTFARSGRYAVRAGVGASPSNAAGTSRVRPTDVH